LKGNVCGKKKSTGSKGRRNRARSGKKGGHDAIARKMVAKAGERKSATLGFRE